MNIRRPENEIDEALLFRCHICSRLIAIHAQDIQQNLYDFFGTLFRNSRTRALSSEEVRGN